MKLSSRREALVCSTMKKGANKEIEQKIERLINNLKENEKLR